MASYGSQKYGRAGNATVVQGFAGLQRALRLVSDDVQPQLRQRLKIAGEFVKLQAAKNVPHETGRRSQGLSIEEGLRVSATTRGASIYTLAVHGGVQNVGAWSKGRGPHIKRASASHYMDRAVTSSQAYVEHETQAALDWITTTFLEG